MSELERPLYAARTLAQTFAGHIRSAFLTRAKVNGIIKEFLVENPGFLAAYTAWEPDAFD